ncbi:MAG: amino acid permease [Myxococcales bacterium]|nr:amino acid permease [Myxococcales bacterium]MCB9734145.1 amino acid permease [Deltaproteobacteria bacterium]
MTQANTNPPRDRADAAPLDATDAETPRVIGGLAAFAVVAGSMLGVGIFLFPGKVAAAVDGEVAFFALWALGGFFALAGSVACGELGAMMPKAGGDYVFQREAFGPSVAFASGWVLFAAIFAGSIASMSVAVFQYEIGPLVGVNLNGAVLGFDPVTLPTAAALGHDLEIAGTAVTISGAQLLAMGLILALTFLNDLGTRISAGAQILLTLAPIAALAALAAWVLIAAPPVVAAPTTVKEGATALTLGGLAAGFLAVNFAYSGWINIIYVASEVKDPGKNVPRSMISATLGVTGLYLFLCVAFIAVLGFAGLSALGWTDAGTGVAQALGSPLLGTLVLVVIAVAIVTSVNATVLSSARVAYAMAKRGAFWKGAGVLSGPNRTPRRALWVQAGLSSVIVLSGTFDAIVEMTSIAMFVTGSLTVLSLFVLRRTRPDLPRPYRATGYPVLPALYVLLAVFAIGAKLWEAMTSTSDHPFFPLIGVGVLCVAMVVHLGATGRLKRAAGVAVVFLAAGLLLHGLSHWNVTG